MVYMNKLIGFCRVRGGESFLPALILLSILVLPFGHESHAADVKAGKAPRKDKAVPITITSDSMKADRTSKTVIFKGDVEARENFLLCSDELEMHYGKSNDVKNIDARGHVRIFRSSGVASSERAKYDRVKHILLLTGNAVIERCADTVRGDRITLYLDDDSALVEGAKNGRVKAVIIPEKKCADEGKLTKSGAADSGGMDVKNTHCKGSR